MEIIERFGAALLSHHYKFKTSNAKYLEIRKMSRRVDAVSLAINGLFAKPHLSDAKFFKLSILTQNICVTTIAGRFDQLVS